MSLVRDVDTLRDAALLSPLPFVARVDIAPFVAVETVLVLAYALLAASDEQLAFFILCALPVIVCVHALVYLSASWSTHMCAYLRYRRHTIAELARATHVICTPAPHCGQAVIRPLNVTPPSSSSGAASVHFVFQQIVLRLDREAGVFRPRAFPDRLPLEAYAACAGLKSADEIRAAAAAFGANEFAIPSADFWEMFQEHATAPFFVFQVFCVGLWCLDEYWYYSILTLFMLVVFEATVVKRRMRTLDDVRGMRPRPYEVHVWRESRWAQVLSDALLPGDVVSLPRPKADASQTVPCDCLLLKGTCVVNESLLTGESVPQIKDSVTRLLASKQADSRDLLALADRHKGYVLFGGTQIQTSSWRAAGAGNDAGGDQADSAFAVSKIKGPADGGCVCVVLRTGFDTTQGKLMRTILFSTERVTVNNWEALGFIGILLVFAIAASVYVLVKGLEDETRSRYKLLLHCVMIVTSVVPPELPMELSLAVNNSLVALQKLGIFCTEPFRIPQAGALDVCCFDKTGTLTSDDFHVRGIAGVACAFDAGADADASSPPLDALTPAKEAADTTKWVLAACNALVLVDGAMIGDEVEKSALHAAQFEMTKNDVALGKHSGVRLEIIARFPFLSELKRMSTVVRLDVVSSSSSSSSDAASAISATATSSNAAAGSAAASRHLALCKGAPEEVGARLAHAPAHYERCHRHFSQRGYRVLALAYKELTLASPAQARTVSRADCEAGLEFAGFLVLSCPLKADSAASVRALKDSSHRVCMITGDHALTACQVAAELAIAEHASTLILQPVAAAASSDASPSLGALLHWESLDGGLSMPFSPARADLNTLSAKHDLCATGAAVSVLDAHYCGGASASVSALGGERALGALFERVCVFARTSPAEKERVITALRAAGCVTMMTGDGSNDTMALKNAHCGVALLSGNAPEKKKSRTKTSTSTAAVSTSKVATKDPNETPAERKLREAMHALEHDDSQPRLVKMGDASIAAPFSTRSTSVKCTLDLIRQGRCTLVTTFQMYKILALNCLVSAYSLSVLTLDGVKFGDVQQTIGGISIAMFFLFISWAKPLDKLSAERPHTSVFSPYMLLSIAGQFALHLYTLMAAVELARPFAPTDAETRDPNGKFAPNALNSVVFLVGQMMTVATFSINYSGQPFMQGLRDNKPLFYGLATVAALILTCVLNVSTDLMELLELVPFPNDQFRVALVQLLAVDFGGAWFIETALKRVFRRMPNSVRQIA